LHVSAFNPRKISNKTPENTPYDGLSECIKGKKEDNINAKTIFVLGDLG
jgi:hypothetical protein